MNTTYPFREVMQGIYEGFLDVASACYLSSRPSASVIQHTDYMVIRIPNGFRDKGDTQQTAKVLFSLFAKDRPGEIEDAVLLEELQQKLCAKFPFRHPRFSLTNPRFISNGADAGFHYLIFQANVSINKKKLNKSNIYESYNRT